MRGDFISLAPHVNFHILVKTRDDKEDARTTGTTGQQATKAEYDGTLVLLSKRMALSLFKYRHPVM